MQYLAMEIKKEMIYQTMSLAMTLIHLEVISATRIHSRANILKNVFFFCFRYVWQ